jgi:hypothetical protein
VSVQAESRFHREAGGHSPRRARIHRSAHAKGESQPRSETYINPVRRPAIGRR